MRTQWSIYNYTLMWKPIISMCSAKFLRLILTVCVCMVEGLKVLKSVRQADSASPQRLHTASPRTAMQYFIGRVNKSNNKFCYHHHSVAYLSVAIGLVDFVWRHFLQRRCRIDDQILIAFQYVQLRLHACSDTNVIIDFMSAINGAL